MQLTMQRSPKPNHVPPGPPPPRDEHLLLLDSDVKLLVALVLALILAAYLYVRRRWPTWFERASVSAFKAADRDQSGAIDREELFIAVLKLYLTLNEYGVRCCAPERETVNVIFDAADVDGNGTLEYDQFRAAMLVLSQQTFGRFAVQLAGTVGCPPVAALLLRTLAPHLPEAERCWWLPARLVRMGRLVPHAVPVLLLSCVLFALAWPWGTAAVDAGATRIARRCHLPAISRPLPPSPSFSDLPWAPRASLAARAAGAISRLLPPSPAFSDLL